MPTWITIPLDYQRWTGGTDVFVKAEAPFDALSLGKITPAQDKSRQAFFQEHLKRISCHLGSNTIPVFIDFNGDRRRMDKGCIGHAVAAGFLEAPENGREGYLASVNLTESS